MRKSLTKSPNRKYRPCPSLTFSINAVRRRMRDGKYTEKLEIGAAIYMTGVLEYLTCEVMCLAGDVAKAKSKDRITPRDLQIAIRNSGEMSQVLAAYRLPDKRIGHHKTTESEKIQHLKTSNDALKSKIENLENQITQLSNKHEALITTVIKISQSCSIN